MKTPVCRCFLFAWVSVIILVGMNSLAFAGNIIPNGDFVKGEIGQLPEGWTLVTPNPALAPTFQLVESNGKRFLMAQGNGHTQCFGFARVPVTLERNKTYRLTVRFKVEGIDDVNRNLQHSLIVPGWNNFNNGVFDYRREGDMIVGEHVFPVSESGTYLGRVEPCEMRLVFRFHPHGKVWWEEVRLEECEPTAPRPVKIAVSVGKRNSNLDGWKAFLDDAGQRKCDIALLTEYFVSDVQEMDGPAMTMMSEKAKEWKMYVTCSIKLKRGDVVYNSAPLFDREGKLVGIYDKLNLYDPELDQGISPGESVPVFDADFGKLGIMICYDSWHPAVAKLLALKGAEIILCPNVGYYMQIMHARAADNGVVVAVTSSDGPAGVWDAGGHRADGGSTDASRRGPTQIIAFEESADKKGQFVTVDLSIEASPHYWGGPMLSAPGGRRVRATGNFYLEDKIAEEVRRWETALPLVTPWLQPLIVGQTPAKLDIPKEFIRTTGTKFVDGDGKEFIIKGMGFYHGNPATAPVPPASFNEETYKNLSSIGFNSVRFYFGANTFENVADDRTVTFKEDAFKWLDRHIEWAKNHNMKIVLNMHHSPEETGIGARTLFTHLGRQNRFVALWKEIAKRYAHEPTILGFDLINEPHCKILDGDTPENKFAGAFKLYQDIMQRTIDAMREVNKNHVIIVERLWIEGVDEEALKVRRNYYNSRPNDQRDTWQNVNGKYNFPDLVDHNYALTYHVYEPGRYAHQFTGVAGQFDDDGSGGPNRVYPSERVAKWNENDPKTGKPWTMNKDFLEYSYTIPLKYIREVKGVPAFVGELGTHVSNFEDNQQGVNKGGRQYILDLMDVLDKNGLSFSYHCFRINEFHPRFNERLDRAFRTAFSTK